MVGRITIMAPLLAWEHDPARVPFKPICAMCVYVAFRIRNKAGCAWTSLILIHGGRCLWHMPERSPMAENRHVRLFRNSRNQTVRIPAEFELPGDEASSTVTATFS
jgi:hypothetical protein